MTFTAGICNECAANFLNGGDDNAPTPIFRFDAILSDDPVGESSPRWECEGCGLTGIMFEDIWELTSMSGHPVMASMSDIDSAVEAYEEALIWTSTFFHDGEGECDMWPESCPGHHLDEAYDVDDLDPEARQSMRLDVFRFLANNIADVLAIGNMSMVGHDLALTRNGYGVGFWDRGYGEVGERLTVAAHALGEIDVYPGDDGKLYVS